MTDLAPLVIVIFLQNRVAFIPGAAFTHINSSPLSVRISAGISDDACDLYAVRFHMAAVIDHLYA